MKYGDEAAIDHLCESRQAAELDEANLVGKKIPPRFTKFGEERIIPRLEFEIEITSRCNFNCPMCFNQTRRAEAKGPDMKFSEFKRIIDGLVKYRKKIHREFILTAQRKISDVEQHVISPFHLCVAGGEFFLNPLSPKMLAYAVQKLGRNSVSVTTNFSTFPANVPQIIALLKSCGLPRVNLSIDPTHLSEHGKIKSDVVAKLTAFFSAANSVGATVHVIATYTGEKEKRRGLPKEILKLIPKEIFDNNFFQVRREIFSKEDNKEHKSFLNNFGKNRFGSEEYLWSWGKVTPFLTLSQPYVIFRNNGFARISFPEHLALPQFSLGNWKREPLSAVLGKNLHFRTDQIKRWFFGVNSAGEKISLTQAQRIARIASRKLSKELGYREKARKAELAKLAPWKRLFSRVMR
jgi:organic radical activating enzyme